MMSAATAAGSSNAAFVFKTPVPLIDAAANRVLQEGVQAGYGSGATEFMSGCGRGYARKKRADGPPAWMCASLYELHKLPVC